MTRIYVSYTKHIHIYIKARRHKSSAAECDIHVAFAMTNFISSGYKKKRKKVQITQIRRDIQIYTMRNRISLYVLFYIHTYVSFA